jgi:hypothetical protein
MADLMADEKVVSMAARKAGNWAVKKVALMEMKMVEY